MSIAPLSPRSTICQRIKDEQPCHITFSQGQHRYKTEIDEHSNIQEIFDDAVEYLQCEFNRQSGPTFEQFIISITAKKNPDSEPFTTHYNPLYKIPIPEATFCISEPGTPTKE